MKVATVSYFGLVYLVTNLVNGKVYVGQTTQTMKRRWQGHVSDASTRSHLVPLHLAILKYGVTQFKVQLLETCPDREALDKAECKWVGLFDSGNSSKGYNCTKGGDRGFDFTEDTKSKIASSMRSFWEDPSYRDYIKDTMRAKWSNPSYRAAQVAAITEGVRKAEYRQRVSETSAAYMRAHPEMRGRLSEHNKTTEGRGALSVAQRKRFANPEAREKLSQSTLALMRVPAWREQALRGLAAARSKRMQTWLVEEAIRPLLQGLTARQYTSSRRDTKGLPGVEHFPRIYGKTFAEVQDGGVL